MKKGIIYPSSLADTVLSNSFGNLSYFALRHTSFLNHFSKNVFELKFDTSIYIIRKKKDLEHCRKNYFVI